MGVANPALARFFYVRSMFTQLTNGEYIVAMASSVECSVDCSFSLLCLYYAIWSYVAGTFTTLSLALTFAEHLGPYSLMKSRELNNDD